MNPTLKQGQQYTDPRGNTGIVNYDTLTGKKLMTGASTPLDASRIQNSATVTVPPPINTNDAFNRLSTTVGAVGNLAETNFSLGSAEDAAAIANPDPTKKQGIFDRIGQIIGLQSKKGEKALQIQEDEGVFAKKTAARKLENDIIAKTRAYDKQAERIRANSEGKFGGAVEQDLNNLERQRNSELADLSIQYKIAAGDYKDALEIAQAKVEAEFEPLENEIQSLTQLYNLQQNDLSESEKLQIETLIDERKAAVNFAREQEMLKYKAQIEQSDPLYKAQVANIYSQIAERNATVSPSQVSIPSIINPETGKVDPSNQLASVLSNPAVKDNPKLQDINGVIAAAQQFAQENPDGKFPAVSLGGVAGSSFEALAGPRGTANSTAINAINLKVQQWASGASLTEQQTKQVEKITPKIGDTNAQIRNKTNALANFMLNQARGILTSQGIPFQPEKIDFFSPIVTSPDGEQIQIVKKK